MYTSSHFSPSAQTLPRPQHVNPNKRVVVPPLSSLSSATTKAGLVLPEEALNNVNPKAQQPDPSILLKHERDRRHNASHQTDKTQHKRDIARRPTSLPVRKLKDARSSWMPYLRQHHLLKPLSEEAQDALVKSVGDLSCTVSKSILTTIHLTKDVAKYVDDKVKAWEAALNAAAEEERVNKSAKRHGPAPVAKVLKANELVTRIRKIKLYDENWFDGPSIIS
ncbi:hypothetical protein BCR44DRAFT_1013179 [Catenaria anguillulae PL171]|uniref:Uncharacterized protein n=1 Tax=Catenaria anguillulae PL171 TaxID=765915 RepID=A0A1Y2I4F8_9FUNG|nr:hypothetical protein BCR44DRAFT_1013179 [Catenaria anguillulae PL171]